MKSTTYHNYREAYVRLVGRRKGWRPEARSAAERLARMDGKLKWLANMAMHLEAKRRKPTRPVAKRINFTLHIGEGKDMRGARMNSLMWARKPWKWPNNMTFVLFWRSLRR